MWEIFFELYTFARRLSPKKSYSAAFLDSGGIRNQLNECGVPSERLFIDRFAAARIQSFHFCISFEILPRVFREPFASYLDTGLFHALPACRKSLESLADISRVGTRKRI